MGRRDRLGAKGVLHPGLGAGIWVCSHCGNSLSCILNDLYSLTYAWVCIPLFIIAKYHLLEKEDICTAMFFPALFTIAQLIISPSFRGETEMQRTDITYLRPQSQEAEKAGFKPR